MTNFRPGDVIKFQNRTCKVRFVANVGFGNDMRPEFYDLTDIHTGEHLTVPILLVDGDVETKGEGVLEYRTSLTEDFSPPQITIDKLKQSRLEKQRRESSIWYKIVNKLRRKNVNK